MQKENNGLSAGQLTMMALGTVIGGSFFLGSSVAVKATGPSIILTYIVCGVMVYFILFALSEMTVSNPNADSFRKFASQYLGNGMGFVIGWVYWTGMVIAMSSEATAVSILVKEWIPNISIPLLGSSIIIGVTLLNLLGARQLSSLESVLAGIKIVTIIAFIILGLLLILGIFPNVNRIGGNVMASESFLPGGLTSLAGSMLLVLFSYAGFEIIGLAASETKDKQKTIPRAIHFTVFWLVGLYIMSVLVLLLLIPTNEISESVSPMVAALRRYRITWVGSVMNLILISAILSTMLAAMFGLGRMLRSLIGDGLGPHLLKDKTDVPYKGILFSGFIMLVSLFIGLLFPKVYLFLISSGGFSLIFTYIVLMLTHIRFRKKNGLPEGKCRLGGFPYSSFFTLIGLLIAIFSMPFVAGQTSGFLAGILLVGFYSVCYLIMKVVAKKILENPEKYDPKTLNSTFLTEFSKEFYDDKRGDK
ncbi:amino acid permease [Anaerosacchariphilus polymeriproducens]|uniref:Amino acid permease n=1 Tax=Anaerosacchariphilus polymeriproducens TaxID=1812858 RepID=A0A371AQV1_9FIRM|nr:amino acid permease [Anaerosacchariphilus polymeriproducens]RDU21967.1 amino acid permease [Anaerosacchariphilus polymeriproducens]